MIIVIIISHSLTSQWSWHHIVMRLSCELAVLLALCVTEPSNITSLTVYKPISFLLHSVNLILFTVLLVHLILHTSPHHSHHLHSHHLSLPLPFTPDLKPQLYINNWIALRPGREAKIPPLLMHSSAELLRIFVVIYCIYHVALHWIVQINSFIRAELINKFL